MNWRPIGLLDEKGIEEPLTPALFLLSGNAFLGMIPTTVDTSNMVSPQVRKNMLDSVNEKLWERLQKEFVLEHHKLSRREDAGEDIEVSDVVQFYHPDKPTGMWPLALVVDVRESKDGSRRKFLLKTDHKNEVIRGSNGVVKILWPTTPRTDRLCRSRGWVQFEGKGMQ